MPAPPETSYFRQAFLTALLAAALSLVVAATIVLLASGSADVSWAGFARTTVRTWLFSIGSGLDAGDVSLGLVPIGATLVCIAVVTRTAAWVVSDPIDDIVAFAATTAGAYGLIAGLAATVSQSADVHTSVVRAASGAFVVGGLGVVLGATRRHGGAERWWFTKSADVRAAARAAVPAIFAVLAVSGTLLIISLVLHLSRAGDLWALLNPGVGGGAALGVGSLLAVPALVLWITSALIGPGFALGTNTSVDLTGSQVGAVPGFPLLAALPTPGEFPEWVFLLGLVPLLAGMLAGWSVNPGEREGLAPRVALGAAAGGVAGLVLGMLVGVSGGAIGPGRMVDAGPPLLTPLLVAVPVMAMGGALGGVLSHYRGRRAFSLPHLPSANAVGRPRLWKRNQPAGPDRRVDTS
ncbi:DUF6350 family protein [Aeromicrobium sp.]|uniref:cell division protein PerM n=1 Tax=Aeromicrobium sp. TaxID=1871063 RepID=UPI001984342B|nr:DUF6350 family protein [Aeromicrobium sp.]MBC7631198.1 hypothetical protein [Aeromicrobium sp.]